jgi:hypothetical protein
MSDKRLGWFGFLCGFFTACIAIGFLLKGLHMYAPQEQILLRNALAKVYDAATEKEKLLAIHDYNMLFNEFSEPHKPNCPIIIRYY